MKLVAVHQADLDGSMAERAALSAAAKESLDALITPGKPYLNPLLGQLSQAIKPSGFGEGGSVPEAHEKSVVNEAAMTLLDDIRQAVADRLALITGETSTRETLAEQFRRLVTLASHDEDPRLRTLQYTSRFLSRTVARIEELFDPAPRASIQGPCISCGEERAMVREDGLSGEKVYEKLRNGEAIPDTVILRKDALELKGQKLSCLECGGEWSGYSEIAQFKADQDAAVAAAKALSTNQALHAA